MSATGEVVSRELAAAHIAVVNHVLRGVPLEKSGCTPATGSTTGRGCTTSRSRRGSTTIGAGAYSFEDGNPRHQREWQIWEHADLPEGKIVIPGFLCDAHNSVEHPQLIARAPSPTRGLWAAST